MSERIAVVTGANKGIGLEIVRVLCHRLGENGIVYLTARDEGRGREAVAQLQKEGLSPRFHPLDVTNRGSIEKLRHHLLNAHGGFDILMNNAGLGPIKDTTLEHHARSRLSTNFFGLLEVSRALLPLIRSGGRVVNLSSKAACFEFNKFSDELKMRFRAISSEQDVIDIMEEYMQSAKKGEVDAQMWTENWYGISKLGVVALTVIQAQEIVKDGTRKDILINSCTPGLVKTDMTIHLPDDRKISVVEGADTPVFLALLPPDSQNPQGQFVCKRQAYDFISNDVVIP